MLVLAHRKQVENLRCTPRVPVDFRAVDFLRPAAAALLPMEARPFFAVLCAIVAVVAQPRAYGARLLRGDRSVLPLQSPGMKGSTAANRGRLRPTGAGAIIWWLGFVDGT